MPFSGKELNKLSVVDRRLIYNQCARQDALSNTEVIGFAKAYYLAKKFAHEVDFRQLTPQDVMDLFFEMAYLIDSRNKGLRQIPITFRSGDHGVDAANLESAMQHWSEAYAANRGTPEQLYIDLEEIHPLEDGNGRIGDLFWKIAMMRNTGVWPEALPPDLFSCGRPQKVYVSSFGEIES